MDRSYIEKKKKKVLCVKIFPCSSQFILYKNFSEMLGVSLQLTCLVIIM